jgi:FkbM family methyltransferase
MKLSYAQNLEDFHLDLVFGDVDHGSYVDVGGGHPVADNVSFWFYLKGWRGLVVEPQEDLARVYAGVRPRDVTMSCLAGRADGTIDFHVVDGLHGLSSAVKTNAESAKQYGAGFKTVAKPVRRLSALIDEAKLGAIDFLKIDVEGAEADVLAGLDLVRHRPRVIVVEAVNPNNPGAAVEAWEPTLLAAGYNFVFFDNLNRFYVAKEHAILTARFPKAPAAWDAVAHLWDCGRVMDRGDHPDRVLADVLVAGLMAELANLDSELLQRLVARGLTVTNRAPTDHATLESLRGTAELPRTATAAKDTTALLATDDVRAALGRIACMYDGGHLME